MHRGTSGSNHYDESEQAGGKRQGTIQKRLHDQFEIRTGNPNAP